MVDGELMPKNLTDRYLQTIKPPASGRLEIVDVAAPGLTVRVTPNGVKSWAIRYRLKGSEQRRVSFGTYPAVSLREARRRAREILGAAERGLDLVAQEIRAAEEARKTADRPDTMADLLGRYLTDYCRRNQRRWQLTERMFDSHVKPAIGKMRLVELRRADIVELLDNLENEKGLRAQVNRVRSQVVAALNWAVEREWIEHNPAAVIKKRKIEAARERMLSRDELRAIWRAVDGLNDPSRALVKMLILTGQRRDEIRCLQWAELDFDNRTWTLPAARNKGKRDHKLPLTATVASLLDELPRLGPFVFTVSGAKPYAGAKRLKQILDRDTGITGWVLHDIRRTVRSGLAELHIAEEVAERVLNHAKKGLAKVYNRHAYVAEMRVALEAWEKQIAVIVGDARDAANVARFGERRSARVG
jgi:integrase